MKIDEYFERQYLHPGNTYDNFMFENCPCEFLSIAKKSLSKDCEGVKSCVVYLDKKQAEKVEQTLKNFPNLWQQKILARDFITAKVVEQIMKYIMDEDEVKEFIDVQLQAFLNGDYQGVSNMHAESFMPFEIREFSKSLGKIELSFILEDMQSEILQQAINIFISSREPYCVKVFTNLKRLSSYYDLNGVLIQSPHDFMRRDVNEFVKLSTIIKERL